MGHMREHRPPLQPGRLLAPRRPVRSLARAAQGRPRVRTLSVAIGRPGSETPTGRFAVTDKLRGGNYGPYYGCCILALNAHQPELPAGWTGGNRLAIHGTNSPGTIGAPASRTFAPRIQTSSS